MPGPKTLAELIEELQNNPTNDSEQDKVFDYIQDKERGTANTEAQTVQEVMDLMIKNPTFRNDLVGSLRKEEQPKYENFESLKTDAARSGMDKLKNDFFGCKKRAANKQLKQLAENAFSLRAKDINDTALGDDDARRKGASYEGDFEPIEHTYETEKGNTVKLEGAMYKPKEPTGKVVLVFTGSRSPAAGQINQIKDAYLDSGATVISLDYRGFGKSMEYGKDGKAVDTPLGEQTLYQDGRAMYDYVLKQFPEVKPSDIILHGYSMGGPVAARVAADIAEETAKKGKSVKEEDRLGGVVLHSAISTSYEVATKLHGYSAAEGLSSWIFGGAYNTRSHMRQLYKNDPAMPVHYIGGDENYDFASPKNTKLDAIPDAKFANASTYHGTDHHMGKNVSAADPGLRAMVQNGRRAQLAPQRTSTQAPLERAPGRKP